MRSGVFLMLLASAAFGQQAAGPRTHLKVGDMAPDFALRTTAGEEFRLSAHRGKTVVVAFFPAAFTGG